MTEPTPRRDVVVIGGSAGALQVLRDVVHRFPADLPATVLVVVHLSSNAHSQMPAILSRVGPLPAEHAVDRQPLEPGRIYIAPPDRHLLVEDGHARLSRGPAENGHRPAVDPLFRTAAHSCGRRVVGVVVSGNPDDGAAGLATIVRHGGVAIVQSPDEADHPGMPRAALAATEPAVLVAKAADIGSLVTRIIEDPAPDVLATVPQHVHAALDTAVEAADESASRGEAVGLTCPDCSGPLFLIDDPAVTRFRCLVGHGWSPESLVEQQSKTVENALWSALRALEERAGLHRRLAAFSESRGHDRVARRSRASADQASRSAQVLRRLLGDEPTAPDEAPLQGA